ncbi:MAG: hypothetical protein ACRD8Z_17985 [Nitrososphaeraceae archaeon]
MFVDQLRLSNSYCSKFSPVISLLRIRRYQAIILISAAIYSLAYTITLGIISYYPGLGSLAGTYPMIRTTSYGISIIPIPDIYIFVFYQTIGFIVTSSFLVGLNVALIFYSRKLGNYCGVKKSLNIKGIFGVIPAFFTSFACCGGGLMTFILGPTAFSMLAIHSNYMALVTVAALAGGAFLMSMKVSKRLAELEGSVFCK